MGSPEEILILNTRGSVTVIACSGNLFEVFYDDKAIDYIHRKFGVVPVPMGVQ